MTILLSNFEVQKLRLDSSYFWKQSQDYILSSNTLENSMQKSFSWKALFHIELLLDPYDSMKSTIMRMFNAQWCCSNNWSQETIVIPFSKTLLRKKYFKMFFCKVPFPFVWNSKVGQIHLSTNYINLQLQI